MSSLLIKILNPGVRGIKAMRTKRYPECSLRFARIKRISGWGLLLIHQANNCITVAYAILDLDDAIGLGEEPFF